MSVLHLWHSREWRGGENQFRLLADHLEAPWRGHLGAPAGSELMKRLRGSLPVHALRCAGFADIASILTIRRLVREHGTRLIHAHDSGAHSTAVMARLGLGIPVVVSRRNAYRVSGSWKYRAADHFVAVSSAASETLVRAGVSPSRITVVFDAVDEAALARAAADRLGTSPDDVVVLCVAAFAPEKDHETLIRAWSLVEKSAPHATLLLAGEGALKGAIERLAGQARLKRVRFVGWRDDVANLVLGADIVALSSRVEGLGSSLCEAQAAGKPVVATLAGGIPDAVRQDVTGLLSPPGDPQAFAANLLTLISDAGMRQAMGGAGAVRARELFSPAALAQKHQAIYESLLGG